MNRIWSTAGRAADTVKRIVTLLLAACGRGAQLHPYSWKVAWEALHRLPFLLPHDKSYNAFRHFFKVAPTGLFLDIGANDGISAMSFRKFNGNYEILSLEPNRLFEPALKKMKSRDPRFDYRMVGAGSVPAKMKFFMPVYKGIALHTFTSANCEHVQQAIEYQFGARVARCTKIEVIDGEVVRLDDLGLTPAIVKIDAEGFDHDVLVGMAATIARTRPFIAIEMAWSDRNQVAAFLLKYDYLLAVYIVAADVFIVDLEQNCSRTADQRNLFAIPRERSSLLPFIERNGNVWR